MLFDGEGVLYLNNELFLAEMDFNSSYNKFYLGDIEYGSKILKFIIDWSLREYNLESVNVLINDQIFQLCMVNLLKYTYWHSATSFPKVLQFELTYNNINIIK